MFVTEKRDLTVKGRLCYNGKPLRAWTDKEDTASPTVSQEGVTLTSAIAAEEGRDKMSGDVPNLFLPLKLSVPFEAKYLIYRAALDLLHIERLF